MENKAYAYWLCTVPSVGNKTIAKLQKSMGTAEQIYHAGEEEWGRVLTGPQMEQMKLHKRDWRLQEEYEKMKAEGIRLLLNGDKDYPGRLRQIPDAPYGIFLKGKLPAGDKPAVAVIGARDCSEYGRYVATELGKYLGERGLQVISGMARGIDSVSQEAALHAGGASFAVLGSGVDVCYPAQNRKLYEQIQEQGGILSIYPPGTAPRPQNFPPRNRIVSGLADVVVVIEARRKSGTLITVDMALEQGKEVYVVPGRITDRLSDGCNGLLKQGAAVLLSPEQFLTEIQELWEKQHREAWDEAGEKEEDEKQDGEKTEKTKKENGSVKVIPSGKKGRVLPVQKPEKKQAEKESSLTDDLKLVYDLLDFYPQPLEQLLTKLSEGYTISRLNTALMRLCLANYAVQVSPGHFCRRYDPT